MPQVDFFSAREDQVALLEFVLQQTDVRIFEFSSRRDSEVREFRSVSEVDDAYTLGIHPGGSGHAVMLQLWSPGAMPTIRFRRIVFDRKYVPDAKFRMEPDGGGLMQLYFGGVRDGEISPSHFGHFSEAGARKCDRDKGTDWTQLARLSRKLQYHIRNRLAVHRLPGRPILADAARLWKQGFVLVEGIERHDWEDAVLCEDG